MVKPKKEMRYTTLIILKEDIKRLTDARNKWKEDNKNFSQVGLSIFINYLLDYYEQNEAKKGQNN